MYSPPPAPPLTPFATRRRAYLSGARTPREDMEATIERVLAREATLHAFAFLDVEACRRAADASTERYRAGRPRGVLDGCPVGIKDIIETRDMPTGCGNAAFAGRMTGRDAACVTALREAGAIPFGKTVTTEFAIGGPGPTVNAHDTERTPGGSSSGSGAVVGAGLLPLALGTQTQGSVLRPASYNGCFGYKGTLGALPTGGVHPLSVTHDHLGLLANSLDELWAAASAIAAIGSPGHPRLAGAADSAPAPAKPRRLIRLTLKGWDEVSVAHREIFNAQCRALAARGVEFIGREDSEEVRALESYLDAHVDGSLDMVTYDMRFPYRDYVEQHGEAIGPRIHGLIARGRDMTALDYEELRLKQSIARRLTTRTLTALDADAFVLPAASGPAPKGHALTGSRTYLAYWSWLGFPSFSLPLMAADGLPWGLQLAGTAQMDARLCALARWVCGEVPS
ncbi:amidase [Ancylobacter sp. A5.8]|uniref:amidase n=1 Tax=Ancylobacter gelatini TaxID=2919920 RepID=UPI001F4EBCC9|nr:amidase [Ancylobacter gelatini]MCJ8142576.1 amidase [Ancylobacter gelatini]